MGTVDGTLGDDVIDASYASDPQNDRIDALDTQVPGAGLNDDVVDAGAGEDSVAAGLGDDLVFGGADADILAGGRGDDTLFGGEGNDSIRGNEGEDRLFGGAGDDTLKGGDDRDTLDGGEGADFLGGEGGADVIIGGLGDTVDGGDTGTDVDVLDLRGLGDYRIDDLQPDSNGNGFSGTISVLDGTGAVLGTIEFVEIEGFLDDSNRPPVALADLVRIPSDETSIIDVLANDSDPDGDPLTVFDATSSDGAVEINADGTLSFTPTPGFVGPAEITYAIRDGNGGVDFTTVTAIVLNDDGRDGVVTGTDAADVIDLAYTGDPDGDVVDGGDAILDGFGGDEDLVFALDGDDSINAGAGSDVVFGGAGDDTISGDATGLPAGDDALFGGEGNDTVSGGAGEDFITGNEGDDRLFGGDDGDSIIGGEGSDYIEGGAGDDTIDSSNERFGLYDNPYPPLPADADPFDDRDEVYGGAGNDTIRTGDDQDMVYGGTGADTIDAGVDDDVIEGGDGDDTLIGNEGNDTIFGGTGNDTINGDLPSGQANALNIADVDGDLVTDNGQDTIFGGDGNDTINGGDDADTLFGGTGDDVLDGGIDDDVVFGGAGNDVITGGQGADALSGGADADTFIGGNGGDAVDGGSEGDDNDTLDLTGSAVDFITFTSADREDGVVTFQDGTTMTFAEIENVIPCFTPGTTIATPRGEVLVEELKAGDRVITRDNGIQEIRWVGVKDVSGTKLVGSPHLRPVMIKAGALGYGLPERDMLVSPNHRVLVANDRTQLYFEENEVLASAKHLVGSDGIVTMDMMKVSYIHFMFDRHEVVLSNGAWTESFQPGDYSLKGIGNAQRTEILELFPELQTNEGLQDYHAARKTLKKHEAQLLLT